MRPSALFLPVLVTGLLAACTLPASTPPETPSASPPPATAGGWGQPIAAAASAAPPLRLQGEAAPQCVPEGGDCGPPQAQCCVGYTCAGINRSICISKH